MINNALARAVEPQIDETKAWFQAMFRYNQLDGAGRCDFFNKELISSKSEAMIWGEVFKSAMFRARWEKFQAREAAKYPTK